MLIYTEYVIKSYDITLISRDSHLNVNLFKYTLTCIFYPMFFNKVSNCDPVLPTVPPFGAITS